MIRIYALILTIVSVCCLMNAQTDTIVTHKLDEVVVTGTNRAESRNLLPYTVTVVGSGQLEATGSSQLLSAVSGLVPSLFVTERNIIGFGVSNGGSGHIKMRGVGGDRASSVLMMVDGQPQFAGIYSHHVADFYQTEYVDKVEVLRGPGSVLYGSNAMAGVINVITKNPKTNGVKTSISLKYGSYNTLLTSLTNSTRFGRFSSLVSLGYDRTDGITKNFDFRQSDIYAKIGYDFSDHWQGNADYTLVQSIGNDPVYPTLSNPESTDIYHQNIIRGEASLSASNSYSSTDGTIRLYYSYGNHYVDDPRHFHSLDDRLGILAYQNIRPWKESHITLGFDFDRYTGKIPVSGGKGHTDGSLTTISRKDITEYSPYLTIAQSFLNDIINLNGGLRVAISSMFPTQLVPQIGIALRPGADWNIKASLSKGYRNPSFRELYLYKFANPDLEPEKMWNYELSAGKTFGKWLSFDMTAYFSKGSDIIQTVDQKNCNTGRFINKGVELSARSHPIKPLHVWATYSFLHSSLDNLTGAPRNQYYLGIGWDAVTKLHIDAELKGVTGLFVSEDMNRQNYATLNMRFTYDILKWLRLSLDLDNITYTKYTINKGYPMPGFTASGGIRISI